MIGTIGSLGKRSPKEGLLASLTYTLGAVLTAILTGLLLLVTAWIVASGSPAWGAALFGLFGLSNGLLLVVETAILALRDPNLPDLRTERRSQVFPRLSGGVLLATSLVLVIALFRGPGWGISSTAVPHTVSG